MRTIRVVAVCAYMTIAALGCERPRPSCSLDIDSGLREDAAGRDDAARAPRLLVYSRSTGFRHDSIPTAVAAIRSAATRAGIDSDATEDLARITDEQLASFGAIVLVSTTGSPFGPEGSPEIATLMRYVRTGGGLVGVHSVEDLDQTCGDYPALIGGTFRWHPGDTRDASCSTVGSHPTNAELPSVFSVIDEIHELWNFRADNHVVVQCAAIDGTTQLPISWWRDEGLGRVFVTTFGHTAERWSDATFVEHHVLAAVRWVLRR
jgi:type 1 glutamine amidotransferase